MAQLGDLVRAKALLRSAARAALARAKHAAREADIPALTAEVESASLVMKTTAARLIARGEERPLLLEEVEALLASGPSSWTRAAMSCGTRHGGLACDAPGIVRACTRAG